MTQPDNGGDDQLPDITPGLWEPLSDDAFSRILSAAMDPLASPMDLSVIPDEDEDLVEDAAGEDAGGEFFDESDELDDADDVGVLTEFDDADGTDSDEDDAGAEDMSGGDGL